MYSYNKREFKGKSLIGFPKDFCVVDIETTGLDPSGDSIIEIGAIKYKNGVLSDSFDSLLQPPIKYYNYFVSPFITNLTGITNKMLASAPPTDEVLYHFYEFLGDDIIVGYNVNFDVNFLYDHYLARLGVLLENDFIDIMRMAKKLYPEMPHHRLSDMTARFGFINEHAHRALSDCEVTAECFFEFEKEAQRQFETNENYIKTYPAKSRYIKKD